MLCNKYFKPKQEKRIGFDSLLWLNFLQLTTNTMLYRLDTSTKFFGYRAAESTHEAAQQASEKPLKRNSKGVFFWKHEAVKAIDNATKGEVLVVAVMDNEAMWEIFEPLADIRLKRWYCPEMKPHCKLIAFFIQDTEVCKVKQLSFKPCQKVQNLQ